MSYHLSCKLPEKLPGESSGDWCDRVAASIPEGDLLRAIIGHLYVSRGWDPTWSFISDVTSNGSGVSGAIVRRFLDNDAKGRRKAREANLCECCREGEVADPALDWCVACERTLCGDCIEMIDQESGNRYCPECVD